MSCIFSRRMNIRLFQLLISPPLGKQEKRLCQHPRSVVATTHDHDPWVEVGGGYRLTMELHLRTRTSCKVVATFCSIGGPTRNCNTPANSLEHDRTRTRTH